MRASVRKTGPHSEALPGPSPELRLSSAVIGPGKMLASTVIAVSPMCTSLSPAVASPSNSRATNSCVSLARSTITVGSPTSGETSISGASVTEVGKGGGPSETSCKRGRDPDRTDGGEISGGGKSEMPWPGAGLALVVSGAVIPPPTPGFVPRSTRAKGKPPPGGSLLRVALMDCGAPAALVVDPRADVGPIEITGIATVGPGV